MWSRVFSKNAVGEFYQKEFLEIIKTKIKLHSELIEVELYYVRNFHDLISSFSQRQWHKSSFFYHKTLE